MRVVYAPSALVQLDALPTSTSERIVKKIDHFASQKNPLSFAKPLQGYDVYRFRIGNYRAIIEVEKETLYVLLVVKREGAYRNL